MIAFIRIFTVEFDTGLSDRHDGRIPELVENIADHIVVSDCGFEFCAGLGGADLFRTFIGDQCSCTDRRCQCPLRTDTECFVCLAEITVIAVVIDVLFNAAPAHFKSEVRGRLKDL